MHRGSALFFCGPWSWFTIIITELIHNQISSCLAEDRSVPVLLVFVPVADAAHRHSALVAALERPQLLVHHHDVFS